MQIVSKPVKNFTNTRRGHRPEAVVVHIAEGSLSAAESWFNRSDSQASSHYMVGRSGQIWQFVAEEHTAWHAGGVNRPSWSLLKQGINPNLYTVGIEHEGKTGQGWTNEMYEASAWLIAQICNRWQIAADTERIIGHHRINSVSRANCPGTGVDFAKLIQLTKNHLNIEDPAMIAELQNQVNQLQTQVGQLNARNEQLTQQVAELQEYNTKLRSEVAAQQDLSNRYAKELEEVQKRNGGKLDLSKYGIGELLTALSAKIVPTRR